MTAALLVFLSPLLVGVLVLLIGFALVGAFSALDEVGRRLSKWRK